ncbi:MAG TPA: hypothetical protein VD713_00140 [Sphingomonadales bacterium]|nr:hypothetical protein [Sphingomonadales bacterium]
MARVLAGKDVDRLIVLGDWMVESGGRDKLIEIVQSVLAAPPPDALSREKLLFLLLKLNRLGEAQALLDKTPQKSAVMKFYQGEIFRYQKKWPQANEVYRSLASQIPGAHKMPRLASLSLDTLIRRGSAEPDNRELQVAVAWKLMKAGRLPEAEKSWGAVAGRWPEEREALAQRAACLEGLGRLDEAAEAWKTYLSGVLGAR